MELPPFFQIFVTPNNNKKEWVIFDFMKIQIHGGNSKIIQNYVKF